MPASAAVKPTALDAQLAALATALSQVRVRVGSTSVLRAIERFDTDVAAARFHLDRASSRRKTKPLLVAVLGGTGTGKSTIVNRLLGAEASPLTASSFRRTFTAGPVAIAHASTKLPDRWLGIDHAELNADQLPARGRADVLSVVRSDHDLLTSVTLIDTPDLDGDQPQHHAQADRVFRWADAVLFLVTPEKYQMTELLPYYRLARRYALPAVHVMNKVDEPAAVADYAKQQEIDASRLFSVPRDDAAYDAPPEQNLDTLRAALSSLEPSDGSAGLANRVADLLDRFRDQVLAPLQHDRASVDQLVASLRAMESPTADVDVSPLMMQLRRRLQQRSVLYLMGPGRMLDRVRQVPGLLARLPRGAWDLMRTGQATLRRNGDDATPSDLENRTLDFRVALADQFRVLQARIDDVLRGVPQVASWIDDPNSEYSTKVQIDASRAGAIADEEVAELRGWLERKWNASPRDTALLMKLIKHLPGGEKLTRWSEAAPYLLAAVVATHHAFFGPIDLVVVGGFSLATWLTERLSNEVAGRARETNRNMARRFAQLAHEQITQVTAWLEARVPTVKQLEDLRKLADRLSESTESGTTDEHG